MLKTKIFVFLALFFGPLANVTSANFVKSHEDFVHLNDYEKNQIIIKTMELVVELESKYQYDVKKFGYNEDKYKKFQEAVSKISSILFIGSAYAAAAPISNPVTKTPMNNWQDFGNTFSTLMEKPGGNCIFAGWPSKIYIKPENGRTYCAHPDFITGTGPNRHSKNMSRWTKGYPNPKAGSGCGIDDPTKIQCNPTLFGYKKVDIANMANSTLFCVEAGNGAHNSAYSCMKEALKTTSDDIRDSADKRISFLREQLTNGPAALKALQEFVYKTCVCDQTPANFSQKYQEYIRPHRTCYGMMEMMSKVVCGVQTPLNIETGVFESLQKYTKGKILYNSENKDTSLAAIDSHYIGFISHLKKNEAVEYNVLCNGAKRPDKEYDCSATCKTIAPGTTGAAVIYDCTYAVKEKPGGTEVTITKPDLQPVEGKNLEFTSTIANKTVPLSCPVSIIPLEVIDTTYTCSKAECKTTAGTNGAPATVGCVFTIASSAHDAPEVKFEVDSSKMPELGALPGNFEFSGKISDKEEKLTCPMTLAPLEVTTNSDVEITKTYDCVKAECSATTPAVLTTSSVAIAGLDSTVAATPAAFTCSVEAREKNSTQALLKLSGSPSGTPEDGKESTINVTINNKPEALTCKVTLKTAVVPPKIEPKSAPTSPSLVGPAPQNPGPPRPQMRGSSDTSAVGIK